MTSVRQHPAMKRRTRTPWLCGGLLAAATLLSPAAGSAEPSQVAAPVARAVTTVTAAHLDGANDVIAHVGDSRAYLLREGKLRQLTTDHTLVGRMVRSGEITEAEADVHPHKNVLMRVLGDVDAPGLGLRPLLVGHLEIRAVFAEPQRRDVSDGRRVEAASPCFHPR